VHWYNRSDGYSEQHLLQFAHDHLASAEILFQQHPSCYDSAGVLCHLAIELLLKGQLLLYLDRFPQTHDLSHLSQLLESHVADLEFTTEGKRILDRLSPLFSLRYPVPSGSHPIGSHDLSLAIALARNLVGGYPSDIRSAFQSAPHKGDRVLMRFPNDSGGAV
jgi:HEPN domain-containing protein